MRFIDKEAINKKNDKILNLITELNSTLDQYYENSIEEKVPSNEN